MSLLMSKFLCARTGIPKECYPYDSFYDESKKKLEVKIVLPQHIYQIKYFDIQKINCKIIEKNSTNN